MHAAGGKEPVLEPGKYATRRQSVSLTSGITDSPCQVKLSSLAKNALEHTLSVNKGLYGTKQHWAVSSIVQTVQVRSVTVAVNLWKFNSFVPF